MKLKNKILFGHKKSDKYGKKTLYLSQKADVIGIFRWRIWIQ